MKTAVVSEVGSNAVVRGFIRIKEAQIESLQKAYEQAMAEVAEAPRNRMSDPDTTRGDNTEKAAHAHKQIKEAEESIQLLRNLPKGPFNRIGMGCVFTLQCGKERETYLMIPKGGGCSAMVRGRKITCMSVKAPVAEAMLGKKAGDEVKIQEKVYKIVKVQ
jgi:transcription elongation GreA/GreB family factor